MGAIEIETFLTHLAVDSTVSAPILQKNCLGFKSPVD
jgi:hypothetical protein